MNVEWQQREEGRKHLRPEPHNNNLRKSVKMAGKNLRKVRKVAVLSFFWDFVRKLETRAREDDQAGFYKHIKTMNLKRSVTAARRTSKKIENDNVLLRDAEHIRERRVRWFHTFLNAKSPKPDSNIAEGLDKWPEIIPLDVQPGEFTCRIVTYAEGLASIYVCLSTGD